MKQKKKYKSIIMSLTEHQRERMKREVLFLKPKKIHDHKLISWWHRILREQKKIDDFYEDMRLVC